MRSPILIGGRDRSGTSLMGSLLGGSSSCVTTPESQFKAPTLRSHPAGAELEHAEEVLAWILSHPRFALWDLDVDATKLLARRTRWTAPALIETLVAEYAAANCKANARIWVDHTPSNARDLPLLVAAFPDAAFIHMVRDGRGVAASILPLDWGPNDALSAARWWTEGVCFGLAAESRFPERSLRVHYENLLREPRRELERICTFCGLEFDIRMLENRGFKVPTYTSGQHSLIGKQVEPGRADHWRQALSSREVELFEHSAGGLLEMLGYELATDGWPRRPTRSELMRLRTRALLAGIANRVRWRARSLRWRQGKKAEHR